MQFWMHQHRYWRMVLCVPREDPVAILDILWVSFLIWITDVVADDLYREANVWRAKPRESSVGINPYTFCLDTAPRWVVQHAFDSAPLPIG